MNYEKPVDISYHSRYFSLPSVILMCCPHVPCLHIASPLLEDIFLKYSKLSATVLLRTVSTRYRSEVRDLDNSKPKLETHQKVSIVRSNLSHFHPLTYDSTGMSVFLCLHSLSSTLPPLASVLCVHAPETLVFKLERRTSFPWLAIVRRTLFPLC